MMMRRLKTILEWPLDFRMELINLAREAAFRRNSRTIQLPVHIDHIDIRFQESFNLNGYGKSYLFSFGLEAVRLTEFNKRVLFAISSIERFEYFFEQLRLFIRWAKGETDLHFDQRLFLLKAFSFCLQTEL
jgi:hypothetical protein